MSDFRISITRTDGQRTHLRPGGKGERLLVESIVRSAVSKGLGIFRTEAHVAQAIRQAVEEVLFALKSEVRPGKTPRNDDDE